jgi:hypothetical protein
MLIWEGVNIKASLKGSFKRVKVAPQEEKAGKTQWLTPVIPATCKADIRKTELPGQPGQKVSEAPFPKKSQV